MNDSLPGPNRLSQTSVDSVDVNKLRDGDSAAWELFWEGAYPIVYTAVQRKLGKDGSEEDIKDITMTVLERVPGELKRLKGGISRLEGYMVVMARHIALDWLITHRAKKRGEGKVESLDADTFDASKIQRGSWRETPDILVQRAEALEEIRQAFLGLPSDYQNISRARLTDELESEEIARRLGIPVNTVRTKFSRACLKLRPILARLREELMPPRKKQENWP